MPLIEAQVIETGVRTFGTFGFAALPRSGEKIAIGVGGNLLILRVTDVEHQPVKIKSEEEIYTIADEVKAEIGATVTICVSVLDTVS